MCNFKMNSGNLIFIENKKKAISLGDSRRSAITELIQIIRVSKCWSSHRYELNAKFLQRVFLLRLRDIHWLERNEINLLLRLRDIHSWLERNEINLHVKNLYHVDEINQAYL